MNTRTELMKAVLSNPDDDAPRLALADWFIANEESVLTECHKCSHFKDQPGYPNEPGLVPARDPASGRHEGGWTNCKTCNDVGMRTPGFLLESNRFADRGELIKTQIELHNRRGEWWHNGRDWTSFVSSSDGQALDKRNRQLLYEEWPGTNMHNEALWLSRHILELHTSQPGLQWSWRWGRGFLKTIRLPLQVWARRHQMLYWHPSCPPQPCLEGPEEPNICWFCDNTDNPGHLSDQRALTAMPLRTVYLDPTDQVVIDHQSIRLTAFGHLFERETDRAVRWKSSDWPQIDFVFVFDN